MVQFECPISRNPFLSFIFTIHYSSRAKNAVCVCQFSYSGGDWRCESPFSGRNYSSWYIHSSFLWAWREIIRRIGTWRNKGREHADTLHPHRSESAQWVDGKQLLQGMWINFELLTKNNTQHLQIAMSKRSWDRFNWYQQRRNDPWHPCIQILVDHPVKFTMQAHDDRYRVVVVTCSGNSSL